MKDKYKEIFKLREMLEAAEIPFEFIELTMQDGYQIIYPNKETWICDAVEHSFSYGSSNDLLELMGLLTPEEEMSDEVLGYISAEEVFFRIQNDYYNNIRKEKTGD